MQLKRSGTSAFLARVVGAALEPWPALRNELVAFHVTHGWGHQQRTVVPVVERVETGAALVWLFGAVPRSVVAQRAVCDLIFLFFSRLYAVRWTTVGDDEGEPLFSLLACRVDAQSALGGVVVADVAVETREEYNARHGIGRPVCCGGDALPASRVQAVCVPVLQLRAAFSALLFGSDVDAQSRSAAWDHFFRESRFVSVARNDATLFVNSEGYGHDGEFGMTAHRNAIVSMIRTNARRETVAEVEWRCSVRFARRGRVKGAIKKHGYK